MEVAEGPVKAPKPSLTLSDSSSRDRVIPAHSLHLQSCIGHGAFGEVFLAIYHGAKVAVKQCKSLSEKVALV